MKNFAKKFYHSKEWTNTQKLYKQSKHGICERCGRTNKIMIVHHKLALTPYNIDNPDIALNFNNLELLCIDCHNKEHFKKYSPIREGLEFDTNGELIQTPPP